MRWCRILGWTALCSLLLFAAGCTSLAPRLPAAFPGLAPGLPDLYPPAAALTPFPSATPGLPARPAGPTPTHAPAGVRRYVFPVQPPSAVLHYEPYHHDYPATDIFCAVGSRFVAPTGGIVDYISTVDHWDPAIDEPASRGGLSVAIIGDDGVRYYGSHLSNVTPGIVPGVLVAAGQLLGHTGHTGDARFVEPHLHFGISHPTYPTDWKMRRGEVLPYPYLRAWAAGNPLPPQLPR